MTEHHPPHPDDLLTMMECCRLLKISKRTFQRLREQGRIPLPQIETSRSTVRWRRGDILSSLEPCPPPKSIKSQVATASTYIRAAAMNARAAAQRADEAAAALRKLAFAFMDAAAVTVTTPQPEGAD